MKEYNYTYETWARVSTIIANAMEYAHNKAIEYPNDADPLWNLDEYVNQILDIFYKDKLK